MDTSEICKWNLELNGESRVLATAQEVAEAIEGCRSLDRGGVSLSYDDGPRPLWHRLFGATRYVAGFAAIEWADDVASLIFLDDDWREHRAIDEDMPVNASESVRREISHGELRPHPADECISKSRAFQALQEALESGVRPGWLTYRLVR